MQNRRDNIHKIYTHIIYNSFVMQAAVTIKSALAQSWWIYGMSTRILRMHGIIAKDVLLMTKVKSKKLISTKNFKSFGERKNFQSNNSQFKYRQVMCINWKIVSWQTIFIRSLHSLLQFMLSRFNVRSQVSVVLTNQKAFWLVRLIAFKLTLKL